MGRLWWACCLAVMMVMSADALGVAQTTVVTPRGPTAAEELVSLRRDMTWAAALEVLQRAARQVIVYPGGEDRLIGVGVRNRHWREALDLLLNTNRLEMAEREGFWEIVAPIGLEAIPPEFSLRTREVLISAVFFVADRTTLRELGVDWSTLHGGVVTATNADEGLGGVFALGDGAAVFRGGADVGSPAFEASVSHSGKVSGKQIKVDALLRTLETYNLGEIIACPQISVVDGKQGIVYVGRDFATTVTDFAGNAITRFHSTGTNLVVTPRVITESGLDFIHLTIGTERSALIDPVQQIIDKTNAQTEVLLFDGEETAVAGLFQVEQTELRRGLPILKDLPPWFFGLRYLFGYNRLQLVDKELVILIKAQLAPTIEERIQTMLEEGRPQALPEKRREFEEFKRRHLWED